jgi:hypothetical protein
VTIPAIRASALLAFPLFFGPFLANTARAQTLTPPANASTAMPSAVASSHASSPFDNLELFAGLDGSKQPQDLGINANMGVRFAANLGMPIATRGNFGLQIGAAINLSDAAVHVLDQIEGTSRRTQTFVTVGIFEQPTARLSWALGYDFLHEHYYDAFNLGQVRGQVGYRATRDNEIGSWFTESIHGQEGVMGTTPVRLDPISQVNAYFRHTWPTLARTMVWAGVASHHSDVVWVLPDNSRDKNVVVYGAQLELPLSDRLSVTGSGNFLTPAATGTVDAYLGVTYYPGHKAMGRGQFAAPMMLANNPEFPVDLRR